MPLRRLPDWAGDLILMVVIVVTVALPHRPTPFADPTYSVLAPVVRSLAAISSALLIPCRRRWPLPVFALCLGLYVVTVALGVPSFGTGIAATVAAFSVANRTSRRTAFIAGGIAAGLVALLSVTLAEQATVDPRIFQIAAAIAVGSALGDSTRSRREYLIAMTERAERAERTREAEAQQRVAEERLRIARDLHDTVAHRISVISLNAGVASGALEDRPERAREALGTIRGAARGVLTEIGDLLRYLRAEDDITARQMPQLGLGDLDSLVHRMSATGLSVDLQTAGDLDSVPGATELVAYRIVQEGLTNAHKHGSGHEATVRVVVDSGLLTITVGNPVSSAEPNHPEDLGGRLGLTGIWERVAAIRGTVRTETIDGRHTLTAELPLTLEERS